MNIGNLVFRIFYGKKIDFTKWEIIFENIEK